MSNLIKKEIHWHKFEESIKEQVGSSLVSEIFKIVSKQVKKEVAEKNQNQDYQDFEDFEDFEDSEITPHVSLSEELMEDISIASKFDCWIGHTNFSVTPKMANELSKVAGIEALKIITRYRFLIGIGRMFKFKNVCQDILKITGVIKENENENGHESEDSKHIQ